MHERLIETPPWWITSPDEVQSYLENKVRNGRVSIPGKSAGGRDIYVYEYGEKENLPQTVSFSSACAAKKPELYTRAFERRKQSLFIYKALLKLAENFRIVIVPLSQPDGRVRFLRDSLVGQDLDVFQYYAHGIWNDGSPCKYPYHKEIMPLPVKEFKHLGAYFNDNGVNCQHDDFFGNPQPEVQNLIRLVHEERPDCILACHACEAGPGMGMPARCLSENGLNMEQQIAIAVMTRQSCAGLHPYHRVNLRQSKAFILQDILYLASGGLPLLYEFPHGCINEPFTHEEIIDLGLLLFEEIMAYGVETKFKDRF